MLPYRASTARRFLSILDSPWMLASIFSVAVVIGDPLTTAILALVPSISMLADLNAKAIFRRASLLVRWFCESRVRVLNWPDQSKMARGFMSTAAKFQIKSQLTTKLLSVLVCFGILGLVTISYHRAESQLRPGDESLAGRVVLEMLKIIVQPLDALF